MVATMPDPPPVTLQWLGKGGLSDDEAHRMLDEAGVLRPGDRVGHVEHQPNPGAKLEKLWPITYVIIFALGVAVVILLVLLLTP